MSLCVPISKHKRCKECCKRRFSATRPRAPCNRIINWKQIGNQLSISIVNGIKIGHWTSRLKKRPASISVWTSCQSQTDSINAVMFLFICWLVSLWLCMNHSFNLPPVCNSLHMHHIYSLFNPNGWIISSLGWDFSSQYMACARATKSNPLKWLAVRQDVGLVHGAFCLMPRWISVSLA